MYAVNILLVNPVCPDTFWSFRHALKFVSKKANVPPLGTADVLYYLNQPGDYPMHVHTAQMETANGVYLNGVATMIKMH